MSVNFSMAGALASLVVCALSFAGMAALGVAMDRHYEQVTGRAEPPRAHRMALRGMGCGLLAASLWTCIAGSGLSVGLVAWCGWLTAGAMAVAWTLPYMPRWTAGAAVLAGTGALLALALV